MNEITKNKKENLLILIDGSSYLHRAFHALPSLGNSRGEPTGAIYGVINMIRKIINEYSPKYISVVFDAKGKNFRHELYPLYKATRPQMANDLVSQIKPLHDIINSMGISMFCVEGVEADDIIGTIANNALQTNLDVVVSTGDKDFAQIVTQKITLIDTMSNKKLNEEGVSQKFGVRPNQIIDYLALVGDVSDNVPGVANIGPKTAVKLLNTYGSLDEIIRHASEIEGKIGENLRANLEQLLMSKRLVTIKSDVEINFRIEDLEKKPEDSEKLIALFKHFEFKSWLEPLLKKDISDENKAGSYKLILNNKDLSQLLSELQQEKSFAVKTVTNTQNFMQAKIEGIAFATTPANKAYIPIETNNSSSIKQELSQNVIFESLKPLLENENKIRIGHNFKYEMHVFANHDIKLQGPYCDVMLESYVLNSSIGRHDLEFLAQKYLGESIEKQPGTSTKKHELTLEDTAFHAAFCTETILRLHAKLDSMLSQSEELKNVLKNIEMPLIPVLGRMERAGMHIDTNLLEKQSEELALRIKEIENEVYKLAGEEFNLSSPKQLQEILFTKLKIPVLEKTPTGQPSTSESVLHDLAETHLIPKFILEYRTLSKLKSTYTDSLPKQVNPDTLRIHTSFNQAVTVTGRLSSTDPNLQNIPVRTEEGRRIRQAFTTYPGYKILSSDYSQIELRVMAHLSKDEGLLRAFSEGKDIHSATASEVFGIPLSEVSQEQRRKAKAINFGLIYGMSAFGLARQISVDRNTAQEYMNLYFQRYPGVKLYMEKTKHDAKNKGFVETIYGRRLYVEDINSQNFQRRFAAERAAINAPMQGSASDIMKIAMISIDKWIQSQNSNVKMLLQVHDELVFELPSQEALQAKHEITQLMQNAAKLDVPILVHAGIGDNWDEAH